eukprot:TRINITY_DN7472_c0_g1_i5.p2 TRINITY_DN7472_c0_g1~~TRINITY_DN7472_c0_g1_i5.p2  ORF type:complete len:579 (-),score=132.92 TRINITY_DN7472_c0_g1_i5:60-1796(-)
MMMATMVTSWTLVPVVDRHIVTIVAIIMQVPLVFVEPHQMSQISLLANMLQQSTETLVATRAELDAMKAVTLALLPVHLSRYRPLFLLRHGDHASYWEAEDVTSTQFKRVVLKVLRPDHVFGGPIEASLLSKLSGALGPDYPHTHIVRMVESFIDSERMIIVLEPMSTTLWQLIRRSREKKTDQVAVLDTPLLRGILLQVLTALDVLHMSGFVHTNITTHSVLVRYSHDPQPYDMPHVVLADLERSAEASLLYPNLAEIQQVMLQSPEVLMGHSYGFPIDIWAVGCMAVEMSNGFPLFPNTNATVRSAITDLLGLGPGSRELSKMRLHELVLGRLAMIMKLAGSITSSSFMGFVLVDLTARMMALDPAVRLTAASALQHPFFDVRLPDAIEHVSGLPLPNINQAYRLGPAPDPSPAAVDMAQLGHAIRQIMHAISQYLAGPPYPTSMDPEYPATDDIIAENLFKPPPEPQFFSTFTYKVPQQEPKGSKSSPNKKPSAPRTKEPKQPKQPKLHKQPKDNVSLLGTSIIPIEPEEVILPGMRTPVTKRGRNVKVTPKSPDFEYDDTQAKPSRPSKKKSVG